MTFLWIDSKLIRFIIRIEMTKKSLRFTVAFELNFSQAGVQYFEK